jgi:sarcosine oxidase, subunit beta
MTVDGALPASAEIVVVGAGNVGVSAALFLARAGREVVVLDRALPWGDASGANAGTLSYQVKRTEVLPLCKFSIDVWESFGSMGLDTGFKKIGGYRVATSEAEVAHLREYAKEQAASGHLDYEWLDSNALHHRAPWLGPKVMAATFCALDSYSSPLMSGGALLAGLRQAGGRVFAHTAVAAIHRAEDGYAVETVRGTIACRTVIIAAGPWSVAIARTLGVDFPFYVDVNMLSVTEPTTFMLDRVVTHIGGILSLKQLPNGTILIGGGWQGRGRFGAFEKETDNLRLRQNLSVAVNVIPSLGKLRLVRSWAGYEAVAPDALPAFGPLPGRPNAYVVAGARGGYSMGPGQGFLVSEMILKGRTSIDCALFDPARLVAGGSA